MIKKASNDNGTEQKAVDHPKHQNTQVTKLRKYYRKQQNSLDHKAGGGKINHKEKRCQISFHLYTVSSKMGFNRKTPRKRYMLILHL